MTTGKEIVNYDKAWADQAEVYAAQHTVKGGTFLSTKGGIMAFGEEVMPGNQACVVILDSFFENTYYGRDYVPENPAPPICYAFGRGGDEMAPHISMKNHLEYFEPQAAECAGCPHNVYGSADKGRGKACQNRYRLIMLPAGYYQPKRGSRDFDLELYADPKDFQTMDMIQYKLSVTSGRNYDKYVSQISATLRRPPHGVFTRIYLEPHPKFQYMMHFEMIEAVPDELAQIIMARHDEAVRLPFQGYVPPTDESPQQQPGSMKGLRRR